MKTNNNGIIAGLLIGLAIWGFIAFCVIKAIPQPEKPTYSQTDSLKIDSLQKQIANRENAIEYHRVNAEKFKSEKDNLSKSNYKLSERLKELLKNPAAPCEDKLQLSLFYNDSLKLELNKCDSAYIEVDKECENYAIQLENYEAINTLNLKRNLELSFKVDSLYISNYNDSIQQDKTFKKAIQKEKNKTFFAKVGFTISTAFSIYVFMRK